MGRQGGIGSFIGSCRNLVGYVSHGQVFWRQHGSLDRRKWRKRRSLEGSRVAARYFGAASVVAGDLWSKLPKAMRRLADSGAFNRLVGKCRGLVEADGQVWGLDALEGLDMAADSSGPLSVSGSVEGGWRLSGVSELMREIDAAVGPGAGKPSEKYLMAHRYARTDDVRETVDWGSMGDCSGWRSKHKDIEAYRQEPEYEFVTTEVRSKRRVRHGARWEAVRKPLPPGIPYLGTGAAERRVRVWVYASEVAETVWHAGLKRYDLPLQKRWRMHGFVTDWLVGGKAGDAAWADAYAVDGRVVLPRPFPGEGREDQWGTGVFVVFTAVEVSEKRGRHWVRLPWCSKMQVHSVVDNWDLRPTGPVYMPAEEVLGGGGLRAEPAWRRVVGRDMDWMGSWDFWGKWDLGLFEVDGLVLGYDEPELISQEQVVLGRAGP